MRRVAARTAMAAGALLGLLGLGLAVFLGPDGQRSTGPQEVDVDGFAIVTAPGVIDWVGTSLHVNASVDAYKPVFVGLGNAVDVSDYIGRSAHVEITSYDHPFGVRHRPVEGEDGLPAAPTALDWWIAQDAGIGGANMSVELPDETVQLAILAIGGADLSGLTVDVAYSLPIGFWGSLGLLPLGGGIALVGWQAATGRALWRGGRGEPEEEVVYVVVEHDGSEREVTAEEATRLREEEAEQIVYVYIDDDGVEHEISAAEAAAYEVVEETVVESRPDIEETPGPRAEPSYVFTDAEGVDHELTVAQAREAGVPEEIIAEALASGDEEGR